MDNNLTLRELCKKAQDVGKMDSFLKVGDILLEELKLLKKEKTLCFCKKRKEKAELIARIHDKIEKLYENIKVDKQQISK